MPLIIGGSVAGIAVLVLLFCVAGVVATSGDVGEPTDASRRQAAAESSAAARASSSPTKTAKPTPPPPHGKLTDRQWLQIAKDPGKYAGKRYIVHGVVTQFDAATGNAMFRASVGGTLRKPEYGYVDYPTNTVLEGDAKALEKVVENDLFTAKVTVVGEYDYDNVLGGGNVVTKLRVDSITVTGAIKI